MDEIGVIFLPLALFSELVTFIKFPKKEFLESIFTNMLLGCISLEVPVQRSDSTSTRVREDCTKYIGRVVYHVRKVISQQVLV